MKGFHKMCEVGSRLLSWTPRRRHTLLGTAITFFKKSVMRNKNPLQNIAQGCGWENMPESKIIWEHVFPFNKSLKRFQTNRCWSRQTQKHITGSRLQQQGTDGPSVSVMQPSNLQQQVVKKGHRVQDHFNATPWRPAANNVRQTSRQQNNSQANKASASTRITVLTEMKA